MSETFNVRASSIAMFFDCPSRWAAVHIDGLRTPARAPTIIGTAVHASTAAFDKSRLDSTNEQAWITANDAADVLEQILRDPQEEVEWDGVSLDKAMKVGLGVHTRYCNEIAPQQTYVAVEHTCDEMEINVPCNPRDPDETVTIVLTGSLDRIREDASEYTKDGVPHVQHLLGISDVKTGARACSQSVGKHKAQIGTYELLASEASYNINMPGEIIQLQTSTNYQAKLEPVHGARIALLGDEYNTGLLQHMARMLVTGDFFGNATSFLCSEKYCAAYDSCFFR